MITIKLLGGAKKAIGKSEVKIDKPSASVSEILQFLQGISLEPRLLEPLNLIIAINGVDSAVLSGQKTVAKSDDIVTIVTVVHGGADRPHNYDKIKGFYVSIIGIITIMNDPGTLVDNLRAIEQDLSIQAVRASAVYGTEHILAVIRIVLEAEKRRIMLANKREMELLIRLACTDQISEAINRAGLKKNMPGCFIVMSKDWTKLQQFAGYVKKNFDIDNSVLKSDDEKRVRLSSLLGLNTTIEEKEFIKYLVERAAIVMK